MIHRKWLEEIAWEDSLFCPEKLGPRHLIFRIDWNRPKPEPLIDLHSSLKGWLRMGGTAFLNSFLLEIRHLALHYGASWIYYTGPDGAITQFEWEMAAEERLFTAETLNCFSECPADQGGPAHLVLVFNDQRGIVVFDDLESCEEACLDVSFYGEQDRWVEVRTALRILTRAAR